MSFQKQMNPGNINVRLGHLLQLREVAWASGDLETVANIDGAIEDYASVYTKPQEWAALSAMPGYAEEDDRTRPQVIEDMRARHRFTLAIFKDNSVFARGEQEIGDASSLDSPIEVAE